MSAIALVCFDLGGVLVRLCRDWREVCAAAGVEVRPELEQPATQAAIGALGLRLNAGELTLEQYVAGSVALLDGAYTPAEVEAVHAAWVKEPYAGLDTLIDELHRAGLATAVLSNTDASHWERWRARPPVSLVQHHFASHELGLIKPDPRVYAAVEERLGLRGEQILFFDDLEANVTAAGARGWRAVRVDPGSETVPQLRAAIAAVCS